MKLLVNTPQNTQEILEIDVSGGYFDNTRIVWDERIDGILPEITLGAMVRENNKLVFSQSKLDEYTTQLNLQNLTKIKQEIVTKTQSKLDQWAMTKNYDGILSASTYATSTIPQFKSDGQDAVNFRDLTWSTLYSILSQVEAGTLAMPNSFSDIEPLLPTLTWTIQ